MSLQTTSERKATKSRFSKILAVDLDRTLTQGGEDQVSPALRGLLERLKREGWTVILATGRDLEYVKSRSDLHGIFDAWILENGVEIFIPSTGETRSFLPEGWFKLQREAGKLPGVGVKRLTFHMPAERVEDVRRLAERLGVPVEFRRNRSLYYPLPKGTGKGFGLRKALEALGVGGWVAAIGDAQVDLDLFEEADFKAAVGDAEEEVKQAADYVALKPDGEGAAEVILKLLQKELNV